MPAKKSIKDIKKYIENIDGTLISTTYINQETPLKLKCPLCNKTFFKSLKQLKRSKSPLCPSCLKENKFQLQKFSKEKIIKIVESKGFKLKSNYSDYKNRDSLLKLQCLNCNDIIKLSVSNLTRKEKKYCNHCSYSISNGRRRLSLEEIKNYINKTETSLINIDYSTHPPELTLKCKCNDIFKVYSKDFKNFIHNVKYQLCPNCVNVCTHNGTSSLEIEILNYIKSLISDDVIKGDRRILNGSEIDIYIPTRNLGIECNGIYWHGEINGNKDRNYHLNKTILSNKNNIKLLHFYDIEWIKKNDIVKSMISTNLNMNERIHGRKCIVDKISTKKANDFHNKNHIQGSINSSINFGLYYDAELVSVMSFSKSRFNKLYDYELTRFSSKLYTTVVGGASKLLKHFINTYANSTIVSYADRRYSEGNLYEMLGFKKERINEPNYMYVRGNKLYSRLKFQKKNQKKFFKNFNPELTEWENMLQNGFDRIWNCGTITYILN